MGVSTPEASLRIGVFDATGETAALVTRCEVFAALRRLASGADPLGFPACDLVVYASDGAPDWAALSRLAARVRTVVVSSRPSDAEAYRALDSGAFGYLDAAAPVESLARALNGALRGEPAFPRRVLAELLRQRWESPTAAKVLALTPRQREVARLIATGAADKEIARALGIATTTAQKHVTNLLRRLDVPNRAAAAAIVAAASGAAA
jgi:DNA-binding NarL/FixJ family response regulator